MDDIATLLHGFWTWQTPISFLAGVGAHRLYTKFRDREGLPRMMYRKHTADGGYRLTNRFWAVVVVAVLMFGWIGWRTQDTANRVEDQVNFTTAYGFQTNDCLNQLIAVLTTRVGYNEAISKLDLRRQAVWETLVSDLALGQGNANVNQAALDKFFTANAVIKTDQAKLTVQREENQYPNCVQDLP